MTREHRAPRERPPRGPAAQDGTSTVEYGLLAAAVGGVLVAVGPALADAFLGLIDMITRGFSA